jgi:hypothetical protein
MGAAKSISLFLSRLSLFFTLLDIYIYMCGVIFYFEDTIIIVTSF